MRAWAGSSSWIAELLLLSRTDTLALFGAHEWIGTTTKLKITNFKSNFCMDNLATHFIKSSIVDTIQFLALPPNQNKKTEYSLQVFLNY